MSEPKWTPGPWVGQNYNAVVKGWQITAAQDRIEVCPAIANGLPERDLIAAAPDLYEALEKLQRTIRNSCVGWPATLGDVEADSKARAALAKARGER